MDICVPLNIRYLYVGLFYARRECTDDKSQVYEVYFCMHRDKKSDNEGLVTMRTMLIKTIICCRLLVFIGGRKRRDKLLADLRHVMICFNCAGRAFTADFCFIH